MAFLCLGGLTADWAEDYAGSRCGQPGHHVGGGLGTPGGASFVPSIQVTTGQSQSGSEGLVK